MKYISKISFAVAAVLTSVLPVLMSSGVASASGTAKMYLSPATLSVAPGSDVAVAIHEDSGADTINTVQANLTFSSNLSFSHVDNDQNFQVVAANSLGSGTFTLIRGVSTVLYGGPGQVSGDNVVATLHFTANTGGTAHIDFAGGSAVLRSNDNQAETLTTAGSTISIATAATMTLSPSTKTVSSGTAFNVQIYEDSGADQVNAVQANLSYNPSLLTVTSVDTSTSDFGTTVAHSGANGSIGVIVGVTAPTNGTPTVPLTGKHLVADIGFKAANPGTATVSFTTGTAIIRSSDNLAEASVNTGGVYTVTGSTAPGGTGSGSSGSGTTSSSSGSKVTTAKSALPKSFTSAAPPQANGAPSAPITTSADTVPPAISDIKATKQADKTIVISWTTSEAATSEVDYGVTTDLIMSKQDPNLVTSHSMTFTSKELADNTTYHFLVKSTDAAGNVAASDEQTFSTGSLHITTTEVAVGGGAAVLGVGAWLAAATGIFKVGAAAGGLKASGAAGAIMGTHSVIAGGNAPPSPDVINPPNDGPTIITPQK